MAEVENRPAGTRKFGGGKKGRKYAQTPLVLRDARWAYRHAHDDLPGTPQQEAMRVMQKEKPAEFISLLTRLEREFKGVQMKVISAGGEATKSAGSAQPSAQVQEDVGTESSLKLLDRWLSEWQAGGPPGPKASGGRAV